MAIDTKPNLNDGKFEQTQGDVLHLSGSTHVYGQFLVQSGGTVSILSNAGIGKVLTSDSGGTGTWQTGTGGGTYDLSSPSVCSVGGLTAPAVLTGKTAFELIELILVPEIFGTLTAPSTAISLSPSTAVYEIGCSISTLEITGTFNQGCINPQGCSTSDKRSDAANCYNFTGCQVVGSYACTSSSVTKSATTYVVCASQTWTVSTCYDAGVQPIGSKGTNFSSPLGAGVTSAASCSITGIYPYYYGKLTGSTRPAVTCALVIAGTKCLAVSTGILAINYSSSANEYTWLAIPSAIASKTCWCVNSFDNGKINNIPSDKYPDECQICVTSGESCWTDICYKVYMSGTVGAISTTMCFS